MVQLLDLWKDFIRPPVVPLEELELAHVCVGDTDGHGRPPPTAVVW